MSGTLGLVPADYIINKYPPDPSWGMSGTANYSKVLQEALVHEGVPQSLTAPALNALSQWMAQYDFFTFTNKYPSAASIYNVAIPYAKLAKQWLDSTGVPSTGIWSVLYPGISALPWSDSVGGQPYGAVPFAVIPWNYIATEQSIWRQGFNWEYIKSKLVDLYQIKQIPKLPPWPPTDYRKSNLSFANGVQIPNGKTTWSAVPWKVPFNLVPWNLIPWDKINWTIVFPNINHEVFYSYLESLITGGPLPSVFTTTTQSGFGCATGFFLFNGECVPEAKFPESTGKECPPGYELRHGFCREIKKPPCPEGYWRYKNGPCRPIPGQTGSGGSFPGSGFGGGQQGGEPSPQAGEGTTPTPSEAKEGPSTPAILGGAAVGAVLGALLGGDGERKTTLTLVGGALGAALGFAATNK